MVSFINTEKYFDEQEVQIFDDFVPWHFSQFSIEHFWHLPFLGSSSGIKYPGSQIISDSFFLPMKTITTIMTIIAQLLA